jgi:hypothetical protein
MASMWSTKELCWDVSVSVYQSAVIAQCMCSKEVLLNKLLNCLRRGVVWPGSAPVFQWDVSY